MMKLFTFEGMAREVGAIGVTSPFKKTVLAETENEARLKLYADLEHISARCTAKALEAGIGESIRKGSRRVAYHPEWDASQPWVTYEAGTAGRHLENKNAALDWLNAK